MFRKFLRLRRALHSVATGLIVASAVLAVKPATAATVIQDLVYDYADECDGGRGHCDIAVGIIATLRTTDNWQTATLRYRARSVYFRDRRGSAFNGFNSLDLDGCIGVGRLGNYCGPPDD